MTMKSISPVDADGNVEVVFIMNGMPRSITIKSKKISKAAAAAAASTHRPKADKAVPGEADEDPLPPPPACKHAEDALVPTVCVWEWTFIVSFLAQAPSAHQ